MRQVRHGVSLYPISIKLLHSSDEVDEKHLDEIKQGLVCCILDYDIIS